MKISEYISQHFKRSSSGGRYTNPAWVDKRQVPMTEETLKRLEWISDRASDEYTVYPMQVAAILLEQALRQAAK